MSGMDLIKIYVSTFFVLTIKSFVLSFFLTIAASIVLPSMAFVAWVFAALLVGYMERARIIAAMDAAEEFYMRYL